MTAPDFPSTLALIDAEPGPWAVTTPSLETAAMDAFADDQASDFPVIGAPLWSRTSAVSVSVDPTCSGPLGPVTTIVVTTGPLGAPGCDGPPSPQPIVASRATVRVTNRIRL